MNNTTSNLKKYYSQTNFDVGRFHLQIDQIHFYIVILENINICVLYFKNMFLIKK